MDRVYKSLSTNTYRRGLDFETKQKKKDHHDYDDDEQPYNYIEISSGDMNDACQTGLKSC